MVINKIGRPQSFIEPTRSHPGRIEDTNSAEKEARMYSTSKHPLSDGLNGLNIYLPKKLNPKSEALFHYPKRSVMLEEQVWYDFKPLGCNKLGAMMKEIYKLACLSRIYTNHCVRATATTLWSNAQVPSRHVMSTSGHRSEATVKKTTVFIREAVS